MRIVCIVLSLSLCLLSSPLLADITDDIQNTIRSILIKKRAYVESNMKLSPEEGEDFWPVYDSYQEELAQIDEKFILFFWSRIEGAGMLTHDRVQTTIREYLGIERERLELKESYIEQFSQILPPGKLLRYYQLETRAQTYINSAVERKIPLME